MAPRKTTMLGLNLRLMRQERGLTINRLADMSKVNKSVISRLESGEQRTAHDGNLEALAQVLEVPADVLKELGQRPVAGLTEELSFTLSQTRPQENTESLQHNIVETAVQALSLVKKGVIEEDDWVIQRQMGVMIGELADFLAQRSEDETKRVQLEKAGELFRQGCSPK